jgi:hypothetical protein
MDANPDGVHGSENLDSEGIQETRQGVPVLSLHLVCQYSGFPWVLGSLGIWVFGYLGIWVFGFLGIWVFGYLGIWVFGYLGISSFVIRHSSFFKPLKLMKLAG